MVFSSDASGVLLPTAHRFLGKGQQVLWDMSTGKMMDPAVLPSNAHGAKAFIVKVVSCASIIISATSAPYTYSALPLEVLSTHVFESFI